EGLRVSAEDGPVASPVAGSVLGHPVRRREDPRLVTGTGRYGDDVQVEAGAVAVFVRSTMAHARVASIDTAEAALMPGVVGVFTGASLGLRPRKGQPGIADHFDRPVLAEDVVRFVGEPVAVVVAESAGQAADAAQVVQVDYEALPSVVDPVAATDDSGVLLFPKAGTNVCYEVEAGQHDEDVLADAEVVVRASFLNQRLAPVPMEPNAVLAA